GDDVRNEVAKLLELGKDGGYILAPAHSVESDVPLDNILAFINMAKEQSAFLH
ncbi:MAG: uroporphyrinogen-III decarboxylase-like protein, partial [Candidatus Latescibacteria bacterium]|nr:uroporphyrinogen-III decarboxylase-like protein [Candidatus Latescibacterota bacterium]